MIGVDESSDQVADARAACEREEVAWSSTTPRSPSWRSSGPTPSTPCCRCGGSCPVDDIDRVFRQVDRVLRPEHPLVLSLPHPALRA